MAITSLATLGNSTPQTFKLFSSGNGSLPNGPRQRFFNRSGGVVFPLAVTTTNPQTASSNGIPFTNPTGTNLTYLSGVTFSGLPYGTSTGSNKYVVLGDILWAALMSAGTTVQTVNSGTFTARDINGTTNGDGVYIILAKDDFNAGNTGGVCTISYTNSSGTSGRTGSTTYNGGLGGNQMFVLSLDNGDSGVRSVETLQFSTITGGFYIVAFRPIAIVMAGTDKNTNMDEDAITLGLPRVYDSSCIHGFYGGSSNYSGNITFSQG